MTIAANSHWIRVAQVVVGKNGNGLLIDKLRIDFQITKTIQHTPNSAIIKIYNLSPNNESVIQNEFDEVILNAGYEGNIKIVFRGNIKHVFKYRDKNDHITEIEAADGDIDYRNSYLNVSLAAGTSRSHIIDQAVASFSSTKKGYVAIDDHVNIRGVVLTGNTRDVLHKIARDAGANWSIQDGALTIVKTSGVLPNTAIVLNSKTGLLETPEINDKGIGVKAQLNPDFAINGTIQLNNNDIRIREKKIPMLGHKADKLAQEKQKAPVRLDPDGIYKIIAIQHTGSNRDKDWKSELRCIGLNEQIPPATTDEVGAVE